MTAYFVTATGCRRLLTWYWEPVAWAQVVPSGGYVITRTQDRALFHMLACLGLVLVALLSFLIPVATEFLGTVRIVATGYVLLNTLIVAYSVLRCFVLPLGVQNNIQDVIRGELARARRHTRPAVVMAGVVVTATLAGAWL